MDKQNVALAGVAQWIECWPVNQKVSGSIPSLSTCLGCGPGPQLEACERQQIVSVSHRCSSPSLSPSLPLSLKIKIKSLKNFLNETKKVIYTYNGILFSHKKE